MIISHHHKFIFFAVGKTGTHSIEYALKKYADEFDMNRDESTFFLGHIPPVFLREKLSDEIWNSYFKFAFVRNTWDMVISDLFWNNLVDRSITKITVEDVMCLYENQKQYRRGITWRPTREQHSFLSDRNGSFLVDHVGGFENIQEDFDHIGIPREQLPQLNKRKHKSYKQYYTPETIEKVHELWERDIELFQFTF